MVTYTWCHIHTEVMFPLSCLIQAVLCLGAFSLVSSHTEIQRHNPLRILHCFCCSSVLCWWLQSSYTQCYCNTQLCWGGRYFAVEKGPSDTKKWVKLRRYHAVEKLYNMAPYSKSTQMVQCKFQFEQKNRIHGTWWKNSTYIKNKKIKSN